MNIPLRCFIKKTPVFFFLAPLLFFSIYGLAQSTCNNVNVNSCTGGNISQDFNSGNGNFSSATFNYVTANKRWEVNNPNFFATYSITSSSFRLATNGIARVGFTFGRVRGTCFVNGNGFRVTIINNLTNLPIAQCNNVTFSNGNTVCANISDVNLVAGTAVHYVISFRTTFPCPSSALYFDDFSVGGSAIAVPIPVTLTSFTANRKNNSVNLEWQTASEFNNSGFDIERKLQGEEGYQKIAFVPAKSENGNSVDILNYTFSDVNISADASQYRLKQVDFDGKYKYSDVLIVKGTTAAGRILIYPNPAAQGTVNVIFDSFTKKDIQLTDINGRVQQKWEGYTSSQLHVKQLRSGIYLLNVADHGTNSRLVRKIVVL